MLNRIKAKPEDKKVYKSLRYRLKVDDAKTPPQKSFIRRFFSRTFRLIFNPITLLLFVLFLLGAGMTFGYFWNEYSERVDLLLRGEVFTKNAGVYSAPKTIKDGEGISKEDLKEYLKTAGYIEKNSQADENRSRYKIQDNAIQIEPGETALVDDKKIFSTLEIKFTKDGKAIDQITDIDTKKVVKEAKLEPKILSSITAERDGRRKAVSFNDVPENLRKAIITTEDRAFFEHYGVNFRGIARALWRRYEGNDNSPVARQGGSSITQQLVKNLLLSDEYTLERKAKEAFMSLILETRLSKEEIFTLYCNQIYLGQQAGVSIYGVGEAANVYFGKDVTALTLPEAAMIAGIIRSPNRYNPYKNPDKTTERRNQVLESMLEANQISQKEFDEAKATKLTLYQISVKKDLQGMPYFSQYAIEQLPKLVNDPEALQHLRVYTTIDPDLQKIANDVVVNRLDKLDKAFPKKPKGSLQAALIAIRPKTGEIVAMVGGRNYLENQFNRATDAMRQPGSVFKPFVYATAINSAYDTGRVFTAATIFKDEKKTFTFNNESYSPNNYGDVFSNEDMTLRDALVKSKNTITVDLGMQLNIGKVMNFATKAGFPRVEKAYPSMALGTAEATPLQVATAYSVFANLGDKISPIAINRITTGEGKTVIAPVTEKKNVLKSDVAYIMDDIMKDVINRGTAVSAQSWGFKNVPGKFGFAGKTGTSRDGWFAGFTPELICVVYVGFDEDDELGMKGADSALPIWADFMRQTLNLHPEWNGDWTMPDSIHQAEIDTRNGNVLRELAPKEAESINAQQKVLKKNTEASPTPTPETPELINTFLSNVPLEFKRVELFIAGTLPINTTPEIDPNAESAKPEATPTPFTTWEEAQQPSSEKSKTKNTAKEETEVTQSITVMICPMSGMRATINCPEKEAKTFKNGTEPKDFCILHNKPQQK
ncbi:MAG: PBP1A family penicillin-binding protein [Pyrinomonadaceae bacterium]|nr:PBP1A family penicillin-binding protein [Pyrinomonadaceae bacterium]